MATDVIMPKLGESITEGTILEWKKNVGDSISRDETISSHKRILGFSKSDLAILILCNCPPDSSLVLRDKTFLGNSTNSRTFKSLLFLFPIL